MATEIHFRGLKSQEDEKKERYSYIYIYFFNILCVEINTLRMSQFLENLLTFSEIKTMQN